MPQIKVDKICEFSSEDSANHLFASNLLRTQDFKSWKTNGWQSLSSVVLELTEAQTIDNIEVGNDCSAFVEVLVANTIDIKPRFQVLLSTSSFMTPSESHSLTNTNRIRVFPNEKLSPNARHSQWNRIKVNCTQPFNKDISFGLAFIRFNSREHKDEELETNSMALNIGSFRLRKADEDQESDTNTGSLFAKRTNHSNNDSPNVSTRSSLASAVGLTASTSKASSARSPQNSLNAIKPNPKDPETTPKHTSSPNASHSIYANSSHSITPKAGPSPPKRQRQPRTDVPFNQLMSKVVFALSGFVNPKRAQLRDKALQMGAKYRPDWEPTCTHLICAFANTPKFNEVKRQKGRIVTEKWIEESFSRKQLNNWRNYILGQNNGSADDSDSEDDAPVVQQNSRTTRKRIQYIDDDDEDEDRHQMREVIGYVSQSNDRDSQSHSTDTNDEIYDMETDNESTSADNTTHSTNTNSENKCNETIDPKAIDIFKEKCFHIYGPFDEKEKQILTQNIRTHSGKLSDELTKEVKYVITNSEWNDHFEQACSENESLIFVKPKWIHKCVEKSKLLPFQAFIVSCNYD